MQKRHDDHPQENLAKSGYYPDMKYKTLIILPYLWLHTENQIQKLFVFSSHFRRAVVAIEKTSKITSFSNFQFSISIFGETSPLKINRLAQIHHKNKIEKNKTNVFFPGFWIASINRGY
jgi:hypothetical protein